jgi:hypothetical protein
MALNEDELIDKILTSLKGGGFLFSLVYKKYVEITDNEARTRMFILMNKMIMYGLIKKVLEEYSYDMVELDVAGGDVLSVGGWIEYKKQKNASVEKMKKAERSKFWFPVILSIVGLLLVGMQIYQAYKQDEQKRRIETIQRERDSLYKVTNDHQNLLKTMEQNSLQMKNSFDSLLLKLRDKK